MPETVNYAEQNQSTVETLLGGVLILPALASVILPSDWAGVLKYLPTNAAASFSSLTAKPAMLSSGAGAAVFCVWIITAIAAAAIVLKQRDI